MWTDDGILESDLSYLVGPHAVADMVAGDINKYWDHVEYGTVEEWNNRELVKRLTSKRILQMGGMHTAQSLKYAVEKFAKVGRI